VKEETRNLSAGAIVQRIELIKKLASTNNRWSTFWMNGAGTTSERRREAVSKIEK